MKKLIFFVYIVLCFSIILYSAIQIVFGGWENTKGLTGLHYIVETSQEEFDSKVDNLIKNGFINGKEFYDGTEEKCGLVELITSKYRNYKIFIPSMHGCVDFSTIDHDKNVEVILHSIRYDLSYSKKIGRESDGIFSSFATFFSMKDSFEKDYLTRSSFVFKRQKENVLYMLYMSWVKNNFVLLIFLMVFIPFFLKYSYKLISERFYSPS